LGIEQDKSYHFPRSYPGWSSKNLRRIEDIEEISQNLFKTPFASFTVLNNDARGMGGTVDSGSDGKK